MENRSKLIIIAMMNGKDNQAGKKGAELRQPLCPCKVTQAILTAGGNPCRGVRSAELAYRASFPVTGGLHLSCMTAYPASSSIRVIVGVQIAVQPQHMFES